jgi:hypothetical protein
VEDTSLVVALLEEHNAQGGGALHVTYTMRHEYGDALEPLLDGLSNAFRRMTKDRRWRLFAQRFGLAGELRKLELTHGRNGFHAHLHVGMLTQRQLADDERREAQSWLRARWAECVVAELGEAHRPNVRRGVLVRELHRAEYLTKAGFELTFDQSKHAKNGNRSVWEVAADYARASEREPSKLRDARIWREYVEATLYRKQLTWSRGLKERAKAALERKQENEAPSVPLTPAEVEAQRLRNIDNETEIDGEVWDRVRRVVVAGEGGERVPGRVALKRAFYAGTPGERQASVDRACASLLVLYQANERRRCEVANSEYRSWQSNRISELGYPQRDRSAS